jgi:TetR/AcrR family transcriptional repressor of nem operon
VAAFLQEVMERSVKDRLKRGCMLVNTALEVAPHDPEMRQTVSDELSLIEAFFRRCVEQGQRTGAMAATQNAQDLARLPLGVLLGIRVLARTNPQRALLEGMARPALALLDRPLAGNQTPAKRSASIQQKARAT